jgi:protein-S-isoprenylcysteine O-methyltransferase Ste14
MTTAPATPSETRRHAITRWIIKTASAVLLLGSVLFLSAGRLDWPAAWANIGVVFLTQLIGAALLLPNHADLIVERSKMREGTKPWDVPLSMYMAFVGPLSTWITAGLDERLNWIGYLQPWQIIAGLAVALLGSLLTLWAMASNRFFAATVRIQVERGHTVSRGGPYRWVRHPGYLGAILYGLATPYALGSQWAIFPALLAAAVAILRTALEDRTLRRELPGYAEYARQVRYRQLPGIW